MVPDLPVSTRDTDETVPVGPRLADTGVSLRVQDLSPLAVRDFGADVLEEDVAGRTSAGVSLGVPDKGVVTPDTLVTVPVCSLRTDATVRLSIPDLTLGTGDAGDLVPVLPEGTVTLEPGGMPDLPSLAPDADMPVPVGAKWAGALLQTAGPDLTVGTGDTASSVPVEATGTYTGVMGGVPVLSVAAAVDAVVSVPDLTG